MSQIFVIPRRALEAHLITYPDFPSGGIHWENVLFEPPSGEKYFRVKMEYNEPTQKTLGGGGTVRLTGLFVIDVFGPAGEGSGELEELADDLLNHFQAGQILTHDSNNVRILLTPWRAGAQPGDNWYFIPCFVPWWFRTDQLSEA